MSEITNKTRTPVVSTTILQHRVITALETQALQRVTIYYDDDYYDFNGSEFGRHIPGKKGQNPTVQLLNRESLPAPLIKAFEDYSKLIVTDELKIALEKNPKDKSFADEFQSLRDLGFDAEPDAWNDWALKHGATSTLIWGTPQQKGISVTLKSGSSNKGTVSSTTDVDSFTDGDVSLSNLFPVTDDTVLIDDGSTTLDDLLDQGFDPCNRASASRNILFDPEANVVGFMNNTSGEDNFEDAIGSVLDISRDHYIDYHTGKGLFSKDLYYQVGDQRVFLGEEKIRIPFFTGSNADLYFFYVDETGEETMSTLSGENCLMYGGQCYALSEEDDNRLVDMVGPECYPGEDIR